MDDFSVALKDSRGEYHSWPSMRRDQGERSRPPERPRGTLEAIQRCRHAQSAGVSGDTEVKISRLLVAICLIATGRGSAQDWTPPDLSNRPPTHGRLTTAITPGAASARSIRSMPPMSVTLGLAWVYRAEYRRRSPSVTRSKSTPLEVERRALLHASRSRLGRGRAHGPRDLALPWKTQRRHPHRKSRRRNLRQLAVFRNARQLPGFARQGTGKRTLGRRDRGSQAGIFLDARAVGRWQSCL